MADSNGGIELKSQALTEMLLNDNDETSATQPNAVPRRDRSFYIEPVTFLVGNSLFKVPRSGFQVPGTVFQAMFSLPTNENKDLVEGSCDENPIILQGIDENKFRAFLTILYPSKIPVADQEKHYRTLVGALDLATFWEFSELREELINTLSPIVVKRNDLEVIYISKKYRVPQWLRVCYKNLIRSSVLPIDGLSSTYPLDWETVAKVYHIRDTVVREGQNDVKCGECSQTYGPRQPEPCRFSCECRVVKLIEKHFYQEFQSMKTSLSEFLEPPEISV